jgi:UDP-2-acetamido-3-amino-2,3-dideoxy-glucuronate N-acetyltransferase
VSGRGAENGRWLEAELKVALVGFGRWGANVARDLASCPGVVLAGISDIDAEARRRAAMAHPGARVVSDFAEAFAGVDAVAVCTPAESHVALARAAIRAAKHVFVEKPLAMDAAEAQRLAEEAEEASLVLMAGHQMVYHPSFERIADAVAAGAIGALREIRAERSGVVCRARDPDVLWAYGPHDVAMIAALVVGRFPRTVSARKGAGVTIRLSFDGGLEGTVVLCGDSPARVRRLEVVGERGAMSFEDDGLGAPLAREIADFAACCRSGGRPRNDGAQATYVTRILEAAERSMAGDGVAVTSC